MRYAFPTRVSLIAFITLTLATSGVAVSRSRAASEPQPTGQESGQLEVRELKPGEPVERKLAAGESHSYRINLVSGQYLHAIAEQFGVNVEVEVADPAGRTMAKLDWWWREGTESLWVQVAATGPYSLKVTAPGQAAGNGGYRIRIEKFSDVSAVDPEDRTLISAHQNFAEGERLRAQETAESQQASKEKYHEALRLWRIANHIDAEAQTLNVLAVVAYRLGDFKQSAELLTQAIQQFRGSRNRHGELDSLNTLSVIYSFSGEIQKALDHYTQALQLARAIKDQVTEASILSGLGLVFNRLEQPQKALAVLDEAVVLSRTIGFTDGEGSAHNNIGLIFVGQGRLREAVHHYSQTLSLLEKDANRHGQATTLNNIGNAYARMGEFQKALPYLLQALKLRRLMGDQRGEAANLGSIGHLYLRLDDYPKALEYYEAALVLSRKVANGDSEAAALSSLGIIHGKSGDLLKALEYLNQGLALTNKLANRNSEAYVLTGLGSIYGRLGEPQKALDYYEKALVVRRAIGDKYGEAQTLSSLGAAHVRLGHHLEGFDYLNQAVALAKSTGDRLGEASSRYQLAQIERARGDIAAARSQIESALTIVETTRSKVSLSDVRANYFASRQELYEFYIDLLMQLHRSGLDQGALAEALRANERRSARGLLDLLNEARTDIRSGIAPDLLEHEHHLQQDLSAKADQQVRLLTRKHTVEQASVLAKQIETISIEYEQVLAQIRSSSPRYAALIEAWTLSLGQIQHEVLDGDTVLLEYSLGETRSYMWVVTSTTIEGHELPPRADIEMLSRRVYEALTARNQVIRFETAEKKSERVARADKDYHLAANELSAMLLGPARTQMKHRRLLVVADGVLHYIPFAALPFSPEGNKGLTSNPNPLVLNNEVVSLPSASTLSLLRKDVASRQRATRTVVVLADPVFQDDDSRIALSPGKNIKQPNEQSSKPETRLGLETALGRSASDLGGVRFHRLLHTRSEADGIVAYAAKGMKRQSLDFDANRTAAKSPELSDYRFIHFATHGVLNSQHPELSGIVLSLVDEQGQPQDGFLRLHEIYNLKLKADLVVLSACRTALGKEIKGEGLVGLTRGFMYAGAPRVVASMWAVDDAATAELMRRFYREMLSKKQRPAAALRTAQIGIWKAQRLPPYYWAAFVLQGEWR